MNSFLQNGILGREHGFLIPLTVEDPSVVAIEDDFSEEYRINIYVGSHYIASVTMNNYKQICNDVSSICVEDRFGNYLGNIHSLIQAQLYYVYLRIHSY